MKAKLTAVTVVLGMAVLVLLTGCTAINSKLTIADAEEAGFERDQQQLYQMIGAEDGWSGTWAGTTVELYQYEDEESAQQAVQEFAIEDFVQPGNISGWVTFCQVRNLLMLSKGMEPCRKLNELGGK